MAARAPLALTVAHVPPRSAAGTHLDHRTSLITLGGAKPAVVRGDTAPGAAATLEFVMLADIEENRRRPELNRDRHLRHVTVHADDRSYP